MGRYVKRQMMMLVVMAAVLMLAAGKMQISYVEVFEQLNGKVKSVVVLDAGHGGFDPGKVGQAGTNEKDINLSIALKVKRNLEHQGITVIMTRDDDRGLYEENSSSKKQDDMRARAKIINESGAVLGVSIHQNSFTDNRYSGAQVFYYNGSENGERLAKILQQSFLDYVDSSNQRVAKANSDYYLLRKSEIPMVIAECGFLSNANEEALLADDVYQEKIAWAIHMGILNYLSEID